MKLIVAVDKNWAIGYKNELLVSIPADMRFFRDQTTGKVVVMGKNTLESFPGGKALKNRVNIVVALEKSYKAPDAIVVNSIEDAIAEASKYNTDDVYVIGGETPEWCPFKRRDENLNVSELNEKLKEKSKEKQIEEMARTMCFRNHCDIKSCVQVNCETTWAASTLYNAGYRKQSEVANAIFDEFAKLLDEFLNRKILCQEFMARFVELKKKYTEETNNDGKNKDNPSKI